MNVYILFTEKSKKDVPIAAYHSQVAAEKAAEAFSFDCWIVPLPIAGTRGEFTADQIGQSYSKTGYKEFSD